ncbi:glycine-rich domain-containing protein [Candidatus Nanosalina sp. VS9-1]|uniref:glycine-rich domain-containing protein n=1 Tax=Candidatus Nanosalina sp. VS9-1 TaxID=3388566 RepID=UPI0039E148BB
MRKIYAAFLMIFLVLSLTVTVSAEEKVEAFTAVGTHTWDVPDNVDEATILVVGGGGGGAGRHGGGGGAGEAVYGTINISKDNYSITVGAGGLGGDGDGTGTAQDGNNGENSEFGSITALGGGGGGSYSGREQGNDGGSGGGGTTTGGNGLTASSDNLSRYVNDGGNGQSNSWYNHGGGGGATEPGETGTTGTSGKPGDGGQGIYLGDVFGDEYGENGYFAGGGGGGSHDGSSTSGDYLYSPSEWATGGLGGGGNGGQGVNDNGENGMPNTGGGGGSGTTDSGDGGNGGNGGSGIVLIKYKSDLAICDKRGPVNECISNSTHEVSGQNFNVSSIFQSESSSVFEALNGQATFNLANSTKISGLWKGSITIEAERPRILSGAIFRPQGERIIIGN